VVQASTCSTPPTGNRGGEQAKAICRRCPHRKACLAWALETGQQFGIWGGANPEDRDRMLTYGAQP
jgi:WhiB family transcriptional regulator, redox-sensing transcriptional regulator